VPTPQALDLILASGAPDALARKFGLDAAQVHDVLKAATGELTWAMERNTLNRGGIADLVKRLGSGDYAAYLDPKAATSERAIDAGNELLGEILGSKHASRGVANTVASQTGVGADIVRQLLPVIADVLMGSLQQSARGRLSDIEAEVRQRTGASGRAAIGGWGDDGHGGPLALPGEASAAPATGNNRSAGDVGHQEPLPIPGEPRSRSGRSGDWGSGSQSGGERRQFPHETGGSNPLDDLSDIIRRGGVRLPKQTGNPGPDTGRVPETTSLDTIVRDILGGNLGFQTKGVMGWIINFLVVRYGWRIVQWLLGRMLGRR